MSSLVWISGREFGRMESFRFLPDGDSLVRFGVYVVGFFVLEVT